MKSWFTEPFSYYERKRHFRHLIGENDGASWNLLAQLTNGKYIFFTAWADYTGFGCQHGIDLYAAENIDTLVNKAMNKVQRKAYKSFLKLKDSH